MHKNKNCLTFSQIIIITFLVASNAYAITIQSFDFVDNNVANGFDEWFYSDIGANECNVYSGELQSKLCTADNHKAYIYYNQSNNDHIGWLRYGYFDSEQNLSVSGQSIKFTFTGGAYGITDGVGFDGLSVYSLSQMSEYLSNNINPYASRALPGDLTMYFKTESSTAKFPKLQNKNRLSLWVLMPRNAISKEDYSTQDHNGRPDQNIAFYPFIDDSRAGHYYHHSSNIPMGSWTHINFDAHPTHHNSGDNGQYSEYREGGSHASGDGQQYFSRIASYALRASIVRNLQSPAYLYMDEVEAFYSPYQNEETIANLGVGFDPQSKLFDISFEDKYRCLVCNSNYEVRYSFSPIDNQNYLNAFIPQQVINYNRSNNNSVGNIIKPNPGYHAIWAMLELQTEHQGLLTENTTLYFAVQDKSLRAQINQDNYDLETIKVPGLGNIRRMDLVKTIDYTIFPTNYALEFDTGQLVDGRKFEPYSMQINGFGGQPPYQFSTQSSLPIGLSLNQDGLLSGTPGQTGSFEIDIQLTDNSSSPINKSFNFNIEDEISASCIGECQRFVLVDFGSSAELNSFGFNDWQQVFSDVYTDYYQVGTTIVVGSKGSYDYQGVSGSSFEFMTNDIILTSWYNNSNETMVFVPRLSFVDTNRPQNNSDWHYMSEVTIQPNSFSTAHLVLNNTQSGSHQLVNINVNYNNNRDLELDKIEAIISINNLQIFLNGFE